MTRLSCPDCRLRFGKAATAILTTCPECGRHLESVGSAEPTLGLRLFAPADPPPALPIAVAAAVPIRPESV
jgi:predicted  nucleic acid-binding Zn-ribbon protein